MAISSVSAICPADLSDTSYAAGGLGDIAQTAATIARLICKIALLGAQTPNYCPRAANCIV